MQNGGFQAQPLMKLTLLLTMVFLTAFWATNFALYFAKMDLTPASVQDYYLGSEAQFTMPRTYQTMLEVTHAHLPMMALVVLLLTHLLIFAPYSFRVKVTFIGGAFLLAFLNEASGWLVRFVHPNFAVVKVAAFTLFQATLSFLIFAVGIFTYKGRKNQNGNGHHFRSEDEEKTTRTGKERELHW